jgi:hypothetical protein
MKEAYFEEMEASGGWGVNKGAVPSLVNTAEALKVLRVAGVPYRDPHVQVGISLLCENLEKHLEERGPRTRYVAFTLAGLAEYEQALDREDVKEAASWARAWLAERVFQGGWKDEDRPELQDLSLFATSGVIEALSLHDPADPLLRPASDALLKHRLTRGKWPKTIFERKKASPAQTGLAVIALIRAGRRHDASYAVAWLLKTVGDWKKLTEHLDLPGTPWKHMSFSICLRACLEAGHSPFDRRLRGPIDHMYDLWSGQHRQWRDGGPDDGPTVRADYAVALAVEALQRAFLRSDPLEIIRRSDEHEVVRPPSSGFAMDLEGRRIVALDIHGEPRSIRLTKGEAEFLTVLRRLQSARPTGEGVPIEKLRLARRVAAASSNSGLKKKINDKVAGATGGAVAEVVTTVGRSNYRLIEEEDSFTE